MFKKVPEEYIDKTVLCDSPQCKQWYCAFAYGAHELIVRLVGVWYKTKDCSNANCEYKDTSRCYGKHGERQIPACATCGINKIIKAGTTDTVLGLIYRCNDHMDELNTLLKEGAK